MLRCVYRTTVTSHLPAFAACCPDKRSQLCCRCPKALFGNEVAVRYARTHSEQDYPAGSVLSLVAWTQTEDTRWFGARSRRQVKSVEFVNVTASKNGKLQYSYEEYTGSPLKKLNHNNPAARRSGLPTL